MSMQIPGFGANGHLPLGRFNATLAQVEDRFVNDEAFIGSPTRLDCWRGLIAYLGLWYLIEEKAASVLGERRLLKTVWLGGSFISAKFDPNNLDLTLFLDGDVLMECDNIGIKGRIEKLSYRDGMLNQFKVSPSVVRYRYARSPWDMFDAKNKRGSYSDDHHRYVGLRGCYDDWWCRVRPVGEDKDAPSVETGEWIRGYVEVTL